MYGKTKNLFIFAVIISAVFLMVGNAAAKYGLSETQKATCIGTDCALPDNVAGATTVEGMIGSIVSIVLSLTGIGFFLLILYAGFNWMTARGNSEKIEKSKETIESAAIGLIVVLAAYAITNFIFTELARRSTPTPAAVSEQKNYV